MSAATEHSVEQQFTHRFRYARSQLRRVQKTGPGVPAYTRWVNRRGARVAAATAYGLAVSPNAVTAVSAICSLMGMTALVVLPRSLAAGCAVAALLALGYLLDSADGQLARLYRSNSRAGEWLDHVVDAFRGPAVHLAIAMAIFQHSPGQLWLAAFGLLWALVTSGQFLSQVLAAALVEQAGRERSRGSDWRSFVLLPTDPGVVCWMFVLWGSTALFGTAYVLLTAVAVLHSGYSLQLRFRDLRRLDAETPEAPDA